MEKAICLKTEFLAWALCCWLVLGGAEGHLPLGFVHETQLQVPMQMRRPFPPLLWVERKPGWHQEKNTHSVDVVPGSSFLVQSIIERTQGCWWVEPTPFKGNATLFCILVTILITATKYQKEAA